MRKTLANELVQLALRTFERDGWKLKKCLITSKHHPLATCDWDRRTITMYPKTLGNGEPPLGQSLLHELIHMLTGTDDEKVTLWLEKTLWRQISQELKDQLTGMVELPELED